MSLGVKACLPVIWIIRMGSKNRIIRLEDMDEVVWMDIVMPSQRIEYRGAIRMGREK